MACSDVDSVHYALPLRTCHKIPFLLCHRQEQGCEWPEWSTATCHMLCMLCLQQNAALEYDSADTPERGILLQRLYSILREEQRDARHAYREVAYVVSKEALCAGTSFPQHLQCSLPSHRVQRRLQL